MCPVRVCHPDVLDQRGPFQHLAVRIALVGAAVNHGQRQGGGSVCAPMPEEDDGGHHQGTIDGARHGGQTVARMVALLQVHGKKEKRLGAALLPRPEVSLPAEEIRLPCELVLGVLEDHLDPVPRLADHLPRPFGNSAVAGLRVGPGEELVRAEGEVLRAALALVAQNREQRLGARGQGPGLEGQKRL